MLSSDDTQPRKPFTVQAPSEGYEEPASSGPGCLVWGLIGTLIMGLAVLIIALSGFAGWSSGQRIAQSNGTATQSAVISDQLTHIPVDVSSNNQTLLGKRIEYLATLTPAVSGLDAIIQTATAVYLNGLPTATPPPTATPTAEAVVESTPAPEATSGAPALDLAALLQQAKSDASVQDWDNAIQTLDTIMATDETYETNTVRTLMLQALTSKARLLYRSRDDSAGLAEANFLTDRAKEFGDIGDLAYESYIAALYLDAVNAIGVDYGTAIQRLTAVYSQAPTYKKVGQLLFEQYVGYGDALAGSGNACLAVQEYQAALTIINDAAANTKLTAATAACTNPTPITAPGESTIAPVGVGG
jgi:hypothetical protein